MFEPNAWFALGRDNRRVPGVPVTSLEHARALIAQGGRVTTVVGRLRQEFVAVDVDVAGVEGDAITDTVAAWCVRQGVWHVVRPSGGAPGRYHVILRPGVHAPDLEDLVEQLRARWGVSATKIDLRSSLRPLSAPHRHGHMTVPYRASEALHALGPDPDGAVTSPTTRERKRRRRSSSSSIPLTPKRTHSPQPIEEKWARYLQTGHLPHWDKARDPGVDTSRSTYELMCTAALLRAGLSAHEAWTRIENAHPDAMTRARADYGRWVRGVWKAAVRADDDFTPLPQTSHDVLVATQEARDRLRQFAWSLGMRERLSVLTVAHVLLRRMERENSRRVPCAERDLVLDTGIRSRTTIRSALRRLDGVLGTLDTTTFSMARKAESSFEFEIPGASGVVRDIAPPSFHTPLPTALPPTATAGTWLTLLALPATHGHPTDEVALSAQLCTTRDEITPWTHRQVLAHLRLLQAHGLAEVSAEGLWTRTDSQPLAAVPAETERLRHEVVAERRAFRQGASQWIREQRVAVQECHRRAAAWWQGLSEAERAGRRLALVREFGERSVLSQQALKRRLRDRDLARGVDRRRRRQEWEDALGVGEYARRREKRTIWFAQLPHPMQQAYARVWAEEREVTLAESLHTKPRAVRTLPG